MMDFAQRAVDWTANALERSAFEISSWARRGPRSPYRASALQPYGFNEDMEMLADELDDEWADLGQRLANFLMMRRLLPDSPRPNASRIEAVPWLLELALVLRQTPGLAAALVSSEQAWRAYIHPLSRSRDLRLSAELAAIVGGAPTQRADARAARSDQWPARR